MASYRVEPPDPFTVFGFAADTHCLAQSPENYLCTEEPGHEGWHRAEVDGELLDHWPGEA